jgi:hypothetical protein
MPQFNLFGEIDDDVSTIAEAIDDTPEPPEMPKKRKGKHSKDFQIGICRACGQLLLDDPENDLIKVDDELCSDCDVKLRSKYDQYRNFALARALRAHKYLGK